MAMPVQDIMAANMVTKCKKIQVASGMNMGPRPTINARTTPHKKPTPSEKTHNDKTPHFKAKTILDMKTRLSEKTQSNEKSTPVQKTTHKGEHLQPAGGPKTFVVRTYLRYTLKSERMMEKNFPRFFKVYKLFKEGLSEFLTDVKLYAATSTRIRTGADLSQFTWRELEIYRKMPTDLLQSAPVLIAAPMPFLPYLFYPICYMFPRQLLCRYFWTTSQRQEFGLYYLRQRLPFYPKILEMLERHSIDVKDAALRRILLDILYKLEQDDHPSVEELLEIKELFTGRPYSIDRAPKLHMYYVARSLNFSTFSKRRFMNDTLLLHNIDLAMVRDGIESLTLEQAQQSCYYRGYNAENQTYEELQTYLKQWVTLSDQLDESSLSLLLHAPVLLSYNKPTNKKYLVSDVDVRTTGRS